MATRELQNLSTKTSLAFVAHWASLTQGDDGEPSMGAAYTDKSVQVSGVFGGATLRFEGSNNGTDWAVLTDPQGNDLLITSPKIEMVSEATLYVRPVVSGGSGTTDLDIHVLMKE